MLYNALGGEHWHNNTNWLSSEPLGEWYGVGMVVSSTGEKWVFSLDLQDNGLSGEIPPELGNLTELARLWLDDNELTGEIPPELGNLTELVRLRLSNNQLTGEIPPELANITWLETLWLFNNQLTGEIPPELGKLEHLREFNIGGNDLSGCVPFGLIYAYEGYREGDPRTCPP